MPNLICKLSLLVFLMAGCAPGKRTIRVSTGQGGGTYHPVAQSLEKILADELPGLNFQLIPSEGSVQSLARLSSEHQPTSERCDLAFLQNDTRSVHGEARTMLPLFEDVLHFIVPFGSSIDGIGDLRGKRVAVGPPNSGTAKFVKHLFKNHGLEMESLVQRTLPIDETCQSLLRGELDAALILAGFKPAAVEKLLQEHGEKYRFVSLEPLGEIGGEVEGFLLNYPFARKSMIPRRTYTTQGRVDEGLPRKPIVTVSVSTILACRQDLPEELVFRLTRAIVEKRAELIHEHPTTAPISDRIDEATLAFPLHAGARRYMHRHEPGFLVTYAEVMAFGLSLMIATIGVLSACRQWISRRKKNRIDTYYVRLNDLLADLQKQPSREKLAEMEQDVSAMQHHAFQELVDERLIADESFRIFQSLVSDCQQQIQARLRQGA